MTKQFRDALLWHMENHQTKIAHLAKGSGVSRSVINKLRSGSSTSTHVENAILLAAWYGKSIEEFLRCDDPAPSETLSALSDLLTKDEVALLEAQMMGLIARRASLREDSQGE